MCTCLFGQVYISGKPWPRCSRPTIVEPKKKTVTFQANDREQSFRKTRRRIVYCVYSLPCNFWNLYSYIAKLRRNQKVLKTTLFNTINFLVLISKFVETKHYYYTSHNKENNLSKSSCHNYSYAYSALDCRMFSIPEGIKHLRNDSISSPNSAFSTGVR